MRSQTQREPRGRLHAPSRARSRRSQLFCRRSRRPPRCALRANPARRSASALVPVPDVALTGLAFRGPPDARRSSPPLQPPPSSRSPRCKRRSRSPRLGFPVTTAPSSATRLAPLCVGPQRAVLKLTSTVTAQRIHALLLSALQDAIGASWMLQAPSSLCSFNVVSIFTTRRRASRRSSPSPPRPASSTRTSRRAAARPRSRAFRRAAVCGLRGIPKGAHAIFSSSFHRR